jgi:hypothetical protein
MTTDDEERPRFKPSIKRGPDSMREYRFGHLVIFAGMSRDPEDRLWGHTDTNGLTRTRHLVSVHYLEAPNGQRIWGVYVWRLCLYFGVSTRR